MLLYGEKKTKEEVIDYVLQYYDDTLSNKKNRFHTITKLFKNQNTGNVLDYGCGWGYYSHFLSEKGFKVTGIDFSQNEIDICQHVWSENDNLKFSTQSILAIKDSSFDYVLSTQVIEHVHNVGNYLSQINRVLKPKGHLIISLPNIVNPRFAMGLMRKDLNKKLVNISDHMLKNYNKTHDHVNGWDPVHFVQLLATVGFKLEQYHPSEGVPFPHKKPFKPLMNLWSKRLSNLSYTMVFRFQKVEDRVIGQND